MGQILMAAYLFLCGLSLPFEAKAQGQDMDLSSMPSDAKVPLMIDSRSGATQGIYANQLKNKKVSIDASGFVGPVGAGIFMGSAEKRVPEPDCKIVLRRVGKSPDLVEVPVSCTATNLWYEATVVDDVTAMSAKGNQVTWGLAKPTKGAIKTIELQSKSMKEKKVFVPAKDGTVVDGRISLPDLGEIEIFFVAKIGSAMPYLVLSPKQLQKLASHLAVLDSDQILRTLTQ